MDELTPQGEFHHFQLVSSSGDIPVSISVLVHYNQTNPPVGHYTQPPISTDDIIRLHDELEAFDGDFIKAFSKS